MLILQKYRGTIDWTEWRHQATRGNWKWISWALEWLPLALLGATLFDPSPSLFGFLPILCAPLG